MAVAKPLATSTIISLVKPPPDLPRVCLSSLMGGKHLQTCVLGRNSNLHIAREVDFECHCIAFTYHLWRQIVLKDRVYDLKAQETPASHRYS